MTHEQPDEVYNLNEEERKAILEGIGQIQNGFYLTQEEANEKISAALRIRQD